MTLNPLTLIEKLINEHGSAAILRDNLVGLRDQITDLSRQLAIATARIAHLEAENKELQSQLQDVTIKHQNATQECKVLQDRIANWGRADGPSVVDPGLSIRDRMPGYFPERR